MADFALVPGLALGARVEQLGGVIELRLGSGEGVHEWLWCLRLLLLPGPRAGADPDVTAQRRQDDQNGRESGDSAGGLETASDSEHGLQVNTGYQDRPIAPLPLRLVVCLPGGQKEELPRHAFDHPA